MTFAWAFVIGLIFYIIHINGKNYEKDQEIENLKKILETKEYQ